MNDCIFCKIVAGEIPSVKIYEDEKSLVIVSREPIQTGHVLVIPKTHSNTVFDIEDPLYSELFQLVKKTASIIQKAMSSVRVGLVVEGFSIPHTHIHLVPLNDAKDLDPKNAHEISPEEMKEVGEKIRNALI